MSRYVIGDVQGCFDALMALLDRIHFDDRCDRLYFTGDLINRGGQSLAVLRWVFAHQRRCQSVLGNHDLSVLHRYHVPGERSLSPEIAELFAAPEADLLMQWLQQQPLLHEIITTAGQSSDWWLCHAGIYPLWDARQAREEARFAENILARRPDWFFANLFGNKPCRPVSQQPGREAQENQRMPDGTVIARMRFAINAFTRMRFLDDDGCLDFTAKGPPQKFPQLHPWFRFPHRVSLAPTVLYGHWSALGLHQENNTVCLDTGKVWGGQLTAMRLPEADNDHPEFISV